MNYPTIAMPISFPMPKVTAAAANPKSTCLIPENQILFPVNNVIAEPMRNSPRLLAITLITIAGMPFVNRKGITGIMAPIENKIKE